jgi:hypothetical protein
VKTPKKIFEDFYGMEENKRREKRRKLPKKRRKLPKKLLHENPTKQSKLKN